MIQIQLIVTILHFSASIGYIDVNINIIFELEKDPTHLLQALQIITEVSHVPIHGINKLKLSYHATLAGLR